VVARLIGLLPAAAFLATFGFFFVDKSHEARTVFGSGRGLLTVAVIVGGYLVVGFVLRRVVRWAWLPPLVLTAAVLGLAAWTVRPYYVDETANRVLVAEPVRDAGAATSTTTTTTTTEPGAPAPTPTAAPPPAGPVRIAAGDLHGIDHDAAGRVSVVRAPDGSHVVRFESFDIEGTPDPQLYVVPAEDARSPGDVGLGRMPGNRGDVLDVAVPAGVTPEQGWTVLVWCGRFAVPIANATLAAT
jgi:hypothetical protein